MVAVVTVMLRARIQSGKFSHKLCPFYLADADSQFLQTLISFLQE